MKDSISMLIMLKKKERSIDLVSLWKTNSKRSRSFGIYKESELNCRLELTINSLAKSKYGTRK